MGDKETNFTYCRPIDKWQDREGDFLSSFIGLPPGDLCRIMIFWMRRHARKRCSIRWRYCIWRRLSRRKWAERKVGGKVYSDRPIDIDLLMYDDTVMRDSELTLPHPLMGNGVSSWTRWRKLPVRWCTLFRDWRWKKWEKKACPIYIKLC